MKQSYIIYKGVQYNSGDTINILWYTNGYKNARLHTAVFLDCDEEKDEYRFVVDGTTYCYNRICFYKTIYSNKHEEIESQNVNFVAHHPTFKEELNIDGMLYAWMWYVFIMALAIIFNGREVIWVVVSIIFFSYRNKKLREAGIQK